MLKRIDLPSLALLLTLGLFGFTSFYPIEGMWGINHLYFLSTPWKVVYWVVVGVIVYLLFSPLSDRSIRPVVNLVDSWLWGGKAWGRFVFVLGCMAIFYLFRIETHLLGDGYTWLAIFGQGESYIHKWAEPGSILLLRHIQQLLGGYTRDTALTAFQIMSITAGGIVVYNFVLIVGQLCEDASIRILGLITLLFSGSMLLFLGYVEFYPVSWAVCAVFINLSLQTLKRKRFFLSSPFAFVITVLMHVQAIYFLPGLTYLLLNKVRRPGARKIGWTLFALFTLVGVAAIVWLYKTRVEFEVLLLPFFEGRPEAPNYTVFSLLHFVDLINEALLILPGVLVLLALWLSKTPRIKRNSISAFLGLMSIGSIMFLLLYGAAITMGRDWDVMALSLFTPCLFVLYQISDKRLVDLRKLLLSYVLLTVLATVSFLAVSVQTSSTEERFRTLLNERNRNGWVIYANHFLLKGDIARHKAIMREMTTLFPEYLKLSQAYQYLEQGEIGRARVMAEDLVKLNPYEPNFLQLLGNVFFKQRLYNDAEEYYGKAVNLNPYNPMLLNELGQLYIDWQKYSEAVRVLKRAHAQALEKTAITESLALAYIYQLHYDSALALADTLFMSDVNSPGGHLIYMVVALWQGNRNTAKYHFQEYLKYGSHRSDYDSIREHYAYLVE